ncbi:sialic acid-binding Ig-like lectin 7 isoform X4 [Salvelinus alpinus]|uniref:sialic acid-binding Ig-like lectin 7 isoform X4 n=1 Tax=Salvelinus alpinus TaxID=8036 RepID=UPI0039FCB944
MACPENMFFLIGLFMSGVLACFGQRDLFATIPDRLDVLTGSCIQIPCSFDIPDQHKDTFNSTIRTTGVWIKENPDFGLHPDNVIFNSSETVNRFQGKITGNMSQKNCTTVFFNVTTNYTRYFFRIESQPFRATDTGKSVDIVVMAFPSSPIITVSVSPKDTSASISPADPALMGSCVNLTCNSTSNPPVTNFTWFKISEGKPAQVASGLSYTLNVTVGDGGLYFCEARNSHGRGKSKEVWLTIKGQEETVTTMVFGIAAGTLGVLLLISLISVIGWRRNSRLHDGLERTDNPQGQNSPVNTVCANQATAGEEPEEPAENQSEEIQYGDIDFSKLRPKETPAAAQDRVQGQESEYAEVNVTGRRDKVQHLNNLDGLYAQVNK